MRRSERNELYKCNTKGLIDLMNDPRYMNNKNNQFGAVLGYLARHGMSNGNSKGEFLDLVYAARNEFIAQAAKQHVGAKGKVAYDQLGPGDAKLKAFIRDPLAVLQREMKGFAERKENFAADEDPDIIEYYSRLKTNADILSIELGADVDHTRSHPENTDLVDVMNRLNKKIPENATTPEETLKKANSGFFGTLFRRQSKEFTAFKTAFDQFRDPTKVLNSGNVGNLEEKTTAYLKHLNPAFEYKKGMDKEAFLANLSKGQKARAEFALNVLDSIAEHKEMKPYMENVDNAIKGKPVKEIAEPKAEVNDPKIQDQFQNQIAVELGEAKESNDIVKEEPAEEKVAENGPEMSN